MNLFGVLEKFPTVQIENNGLITGLNTSIKKYSAKIY